MAVAVAVAARLSSPFLPGTVSEILVAILLGIVVANVLLLPAAVAPGVRFAAQRVLRLGIVLLGARLSLDAVLAIGAQALLLVLGAMALAFAVAILAGRVFGVPPRLRLLIGVGTAVCGNSAIVATAPVVKAEDREVTFAVATITLFGTLAVFIYPQVGYALGLSDATFGMWAGVAVNDTSQVVAASGAYSEGAQGVATVVKLVRNALMAPLIVAIAWYWQRQETVSESAVRKGIAGAVPLFVLGFLAMAALRTVGAIDAAQAARLDDASKGLILVALAAVGLSTRVGEMRSMGLTPLYVGLATATALSVAALLAVARLVPSAG